MKFSTILGQERVIDALQRSVAAQRVAHAYLFDGPAGCGRRATALALIGRLFCTSPLDDDACGSCPSCRKLAAGNHPDLHLLEPLPDKRDISIDQVRELQQVLSLRPFEASRKACLIDPAERMTAGAANALLKTLEEPPGHAVLILISQQSDLLLSTVRSRCQQVRFSPLDEGTLALLLERQGMTPEQAAGLAPLAQGSLERARELDGEEDSRQRRELLQMLAAADLSRIATIFDAAEEQAGNRDETTARFDLLISLLRDMVLLRSAGPGDILNRQLCEELAAEAIRFAPARLMELLELALDTRRAVQGNINAKLALERFLLRYAGLRIH
ncbi:DNA polymerase III subunit delta' [Trichlorobacter ammonificans]|uniref:DNA polymerase III subunit delta' n=1 Tax=Trichlorobacter ammonificans TaxID=2916410 RepID=A0ABN8HF70_9BACT|nr:DNA polymerase III subunit delta' [Trichlorobacter ammonificans]CAH2031515.1 DNA polymerase III delta prime subunit [Trichlorobacter ammonificans]